jgi:hypothetical protein
MQELFDKELGKVGISPDTVSVLEKAGIRFVGQLLQLQHIRQVSGLGRSGKATVNLFLQRYDLHLGTTLDDWEPPDGSGTGTTRVVQIGEPKNGSVYSALLIGGEKRGKKQIETALLPRGARVQWHRTVDKKRTQYKVQPIPKNCDLVLQMADLAATCSNEYRKLAKKDGVLFLSITRKKAQWEHLLDEAGLPVKQKTVDELLDEADVKRASEETLAAEKRQHAIAEQIAAQQASAQDVDAALAKRAEAAQEAAKEAVGGSVAEITPERVSEEPPRTFKEVFATPGKTPVDVSDTVTYEGGGYMLEPIAKATAHLIKQNKTREAIYKLAQRVDRVTGGFESLLPLVLDAMHREGIRGLIVTDGGKTVEYTRQSPKA